MRLHYKLKKQADRLTDRACYIKLSAVSAIERKKKERKKRKKERERKKET